MFLNVDKLYLTPKIDKIDDRYRVELYSNGGKNNCLFNGGVR